jgi:hypothetical protein
MTKKRRVEIPAQLKAFEMTLFDRGRTIENVCVVEVPDPVDPHLARVIDAAIDVFRMWKLVTPPDKWKKDCPDCDHSVGFTCEQCSLDCDISKLGRMLFVGGFIK